MIAFLFCPGLFSALEKVTMKNRKAAQKKRILLSFRLGGSDAVMISFTCQLCTQCGLSVSVCLHGTYVVMCNHCQPDTFMLI